MACKNFQYLVLEWELKSETGGGEKKEEARA